MNRRTVFRLLLMIAIGLGLALYWNAARAQTGDVLPFPNGHIIKGDFKDFYESTPNADFLFGAPITIQYTDGLTGLSVQYFQRARLELHPGRTLEERVRVSQLGVLLYEPGASLDIPFNPAACKRFEAAGYPVCYAFREYYEAHGGEAAFGLPISYFVLYEGRIAQFFERAILMWYPELPPNQKVKLANAGWLYFRKRGETPRLTTPTGDNIPQTVTPEPELPTALKTRAFTQSALIATGETQTLNIIVQDQDLNPVPGATITATIRYTGIGETRTLDVPKSNGNGISQVRFTVDSEEIGVAALDITVQLEGLSSETTTSFRVWW